MHHHFDAPPFLFVLTTNRTNATNRMTCGVRCNGMARSNTNNAVNIRDALMQKQQTNNVIATEWHGVTRTTSVNIRDAPMQKQQIHGLKAQKLIAQGITLGWMRGGNCVL